MPKSLSFDLRSRVLAAIDEGFRVVRLPRGLDQSIERDPRAPVSWEPSAPRSWRRRLEPKSNTVVDSRGPRQLCGTVRLDQLWRDGVVELLKRRGIDVKLCSKRELVERYFGPLIGQRPFAAAER